MDESITKRIHISGLTPAITAKDLSDRLASFGTVKAIDGFGALDALGQPRKFAYATLETTKGKLARCMNLLSGVTWKGAKLRLGEARLDFRERIIHEQAQLKRAAEGADGEPPTKRRRLRGVQGVHARDMTLVTPENVATRGGWRVTPTGRLIRPVRMRPLHPLPELVVGAQPLTKSKEKEKGKGKSEKEKTRKRVRDPPTRARKKTIDPTKYGSQHLKGIFLENAAAFTPPIPLHSAVVTEAPPKSIDEHMSRSSSESEDDSGEEDSSFHESGGDVPPSSVTPVAKLPVVAPSPLKSAPSVPKLTVQSSATDQDLVEEKKQSLGLLQSLFGDADDWGGAESVGSDAEVENQRSSIELPASRQSSVAEVDVSSDPVMEVEESLAEEVTPIASGVPEREKTSGVQATKLKDLFAPHEEQAGFSLLGHLDLDLELEEDVPFDVSAPVPPSIAPSQTYPAQPSTAHTSYMTTLDASRPLFFPTERVGGKRNVLDPTNWRSWFYRTDTPEAIRERWEQTKGELTAGWKRRHREAVKSRRRRGGGGDAD
ncbi:hypothetical protein V8D89_014108 [Ganoderma adspersum]